jgi:flagellar assembly factor FliW
VSTFRALTKAFGAVEVDERQRLRLPFGLLGFENLHDFALLDAAQPPFYWLQSLEVADIAFALIDPRVFRPDYSPGVSAEELAEIGLQRSEDALVFAIVTIPEQPREMTANLQGPLLVNRETRIGRQFISNDPRWLVRHSILAELAAMRKG